MTLDHSYRAQAAEHFREAYQSRKGGIRSAVRLARVWWLRTPVVLYSCRGFLFSSSYLVIAHCRDQIRFESRIERTELEDRRDCVAGAE